MKVVSILFTLALSASAVFAASDNIYSSKRLIQTSETEQHWLTEKQIFALIAQGKHFIDITDTQDLQPASHLVALPFPTTLTHQTQVNAAIGKISDVVPKSVLTNFTQFTNRYYNNNNGKTSSTWLLNTIKSTVPGIDVKPFTHRFPQSSIIARIPGTTKPNEIVVISAHQDSINQSNPSSGRAPGADDDGSGTVTILEALRVFVASGYKPARTIEFHWYAGEEGGLLGSADVVKAYQSKQVIGNIQFDMTGYPANPPAVGIVTDYTDATANALVRKIVTTYTDLPTADFACGYGCSDHASWNRAGFRSSLPFENQYLDGNPNIHSTRDTLSTINYPHLLKFAKIAVAYAIEVGDAA